MKKSLNVLKWAVINGLFLYAVIAATVYGNQNAGNIVIFLTVLLALFAYAIKDDKELVQKRAITGFSINRHIESAFELAVVGILIWHAWWVSGIMYLIHVAYGEVYRDNVKKRVAEIEESKKCRTPYPTIET